MAACFVGFAACRVMIGVFRLQANSVKNEMIDQTHGVAFLFWGIADLILFGLLVQNTISYLSSPDELRHLVTKLFQSSIPRIFVIIANTLLIVILTQLRVSSTTQALFWAIKGTYPVHSTHCRSCCYLISNPPRTCSINRNLICTDFPKVYNTNVDRLLGFFYVG
jgi:hypothetical protein